MKRELLPLQLVLSALGVLVTLPGVAAAPFEGVDDEERLPRLVIPNDTAEFGKRLRGEKFQLRVELRNEGSAPLRITKSTTSCGCATVKVDDNIAPGAVGTLVLDITTAGLEGVISKHATLFTNDPKNPRAKVFFKGEVLRLIAFEPKPVLLSAFPGETLRTKVRLEPGTDLGLEVLEIVSRLDRTSVKLETVTEGEEYLLEVTAPARKAVAREQDVLDVSFRTRDGKEREEEIPINIAVLDPVKVAPRGHIMFAQKDTRSLLEDEPKKPKKEIILEAIQDGFTFRVEGVRVEKSPANGFVTELETLEEGRKYRLTITLQQYFKFRSIRSVLRITTDSAASPEYKIQLAAQFGEKKL